jgi:pyruvate kinase
MATIIREAENNREYHILSSDDDGTDDVTDAVSRTASELASKTSAVAIACLTASGRTARSIASHRPDVPIYAFTDDPLIVGQIALTWGTKGFHVPFQPDTDRGIALVHEALKKQGLVARGDTIVITAGMPLPAKGRTNMVHVSRI